MAADPSFSSLFHHAHRRAVVSGFLLLLFVHWIVSRHLSSHFPLVLNRDTAAFLSIEIEKRLETGSEISPIINALKDEVGRFLPETEFLITGDQPQLKYSSIPCEGSPEGFHHDSLALFKRNEPYDRSSPCRSHPFVLSQSLVNVQGKDSLLSLLTPRSPTSFAPWSSLWILFPLLLLFFAFWWLSQRLFRRKFLDPLERAAQVLETDEDGEKVQWELEKSLAFPEIFQLFDTVQSLSEELVENRKREEEERRSGERFAAGLAHDMRVPLSAIENALFLLGSPASSPMNRKECQLSIDRSLQRQKRLMEDMSELSQLEAQFQEKEFSLSVIAEELRSLLRPLLDLRGLKLSFEIEGESPIAFGDPRLLFRAIQNLLENAIRHSPDEAKISCRLRVGQNRRLEAEILNSIDSFPKGETHSEGKESRMGLGQEIVRSIAQLHQSRFESSVESNGSYLCRLFCDSDGMVSRGGDSKRISPRLILEPVKFVFWGCAASLVLLIAVSCLLVTKPWFLLAEVLATGSFLFSYPFIFPQRSKLFVLRRVFGVFSVFLLLGLLSVDGIDARVQILLAFSLSSLFLSLSSRFLSWRPSLRFAMSLGLALLAVGVLAQSSLAFLGVLSFLATTALFWTLESMNYARKAGIWFSGLVVAGVFTIAIFFHALEFRSYLFSLDSLAGRSFQQLRPYFGGLGEGTTRLSDRLVDSMWLNPLLDFVSYEMGQKEGQAVSLQHTGTYDRFHPAFIRGRRQHFGIFGCDNLSCPGMYVGVPSALANHVLHQQTRQYAFVVLPIEFLLLSLVLFVSYRPIRMEIPRRFALLDEHLQSIRTGEHFSQPPQVQQDIWSRLVRVIDSWSERLTALQNEQITRRKELEVFLFESSQFLRSSHSRVQKLLLSESILSESVSSDFGIHELGQFRAQIEMMLVLLTALVKFEKSPERLSLSEMLLEEAERTGFQGDLDALTRGEELWLTLPSSLAIAFVRALFFVASQHHVSEPTLAFLLDVTPENALLRVTFPFSKSELNSWEDRMFELFRARLAEWQVDLDIGSVDRFLSIEITSTQKG